MLEIPMVIIHSRTPIPEGAKMAKYPIKKENVKNPNNEIHIVGLINISEDMEKYVPNPKKKM